jgi:DNA-binding transcriptional LysR family regulator
MIDLDRLTVFQAVAQTSSFTRAAEVVHLTQPGISKHIRHMEEYFGVPLFDRLGRKVVLTQAGEVLFEATQEVMAAVAAAEQRIHDLTGLRAGRLRVGASFPIGLYILPALLAAYRKRYPAVEVTLAISTSENIERHVLANKLDVGLISREVRHPKLSARQFMVDELLVIVPANHRWPSRRRVKAQELPAESFIWAARGAGARAVVEERLQAKGIVLRKVLDFVNAEGVKHAVEAGLGISIQPRIIVESEISAGSLRALRLADIDPRIGYFIISRKDRHAFNAQSAFLALLPAGDGRDQQGLRRRHGIA